MSFFLTTFIITIIIIGISLLVRKKRPFMYLIPIVLMAISMILFLSSFFIGGWGGVGMIAISFSLLTSSATALILITLINYFRTK